MAARLIVRVQQSDFDIAAEIGNVGRAQRDIGAIVSFTGICRDEDGRLEALELEHYPEMAERELRRIADEAQTRWPLSAIAVIHRYGRIAAGENIVLVVTGSSHREAAFAAASFIMDFLKTRAPFWKKELPRGSATGEWVVAREEDSEATGRWENAPARESGAN